MSMNLNTNTLNKLDAASKNYYLRQALSYIADAHEQFVKDQEASKNAHALELKKLADKQEAENKVKPLIPGKPYSLYETRRTWKPEQGITAVELAYAHDVLLLKENEDIINQNTATIDATVMMLETVGLQKVTYKYLRANAKVKTAVTSEWFTTLISQHPSKYNTQGFTESELNSAYSHLKRTYDEYVKKQDEENKQADRLKKEAVIAEALQKEAIQKEAIFIAHACFKYNFSPLEVTTREVLDKKLEEKGLVPSRVLQDIELELATQLPVVANK